MKKYCWLWALTCFFMRYGYTQEFFSAPQVLKTNNRQTCFALGDMNKDGKIDVVMGELREKQGWVSIYKGNQNGVFVFEKELVVDGLPMDIQLRDVNKDGWLDLMVTTTFRGDAQRFRMKEGMQEIVTTTTLKPSVNIYMNKGENNYQSKESVKIKGEPQSTAIGDFNGDGYVDLVVSVSGVPEIYFYKGNDKGQFKAILTYKLEKNPDEIIAGDFSNTGKAHLLVKYKDATMISIISASEVVASKWEITSTKIDMYTQSFLAKEEDVDGNGDEDAVFLDSNFQNIKIIISEAGLILDSILTMKMPSTVQSFDLYDMNGDGAKDLITLTVMPDQLNFYMNKKPSKNSKSVASDAIGVIYKEDMAKPLSVDAGIISSYPRVSMDVYDVQGKRIRRFFEFDSNLPDGQYALEWTGKDENEMDVPSGNYIFYYRLGSIVVTRLIQK